MTDFNKVIDFPAGYNIKRYLTWSSSHKLYPPSITTLDKDKIIYQEGYIDCTHKIYFLIKKQL